MEQDIFIYKYSAKENAEVQAIRKKYMPNEESKLDELKRLDALVQKSGVMESLCVGVGGAMLFGLGMCFSMQLITTGVGFTVLGILLGLVGLVGMISAYPVYRNIFEKTKAKYVPRILELTSELANEEKVTFNKTEL